MHRPVLSIMSELRELLLKIGAQVRRDLTEVMGLRKDHSRPRNYIVHTLTIIHKLTERHIAEHPLSVTIMPQEEWDNWDERPPLYAAVIELHGVENIIRGIPIFCLSVRIYFKGEHTYTIFYEPTSELICGVEKGSGVYRLGGSKLRLITKPIKEEAGYAWVSQSPPPVQFPQHFYTTYSVAVAVLWTALSRTSAAVIETALITPSTRLVMAEIECHQEEVGVYTVFGEKNSVSDVLPLIAASDSASG